jgi:hypothetical protein
MSKEEQSNISTDAVKHLKDHHENKSSGQHSIPLNSFQDSRASLSGVEADVRFIEHSSCIFIR